jgi:hypothetical protein
VNRDGLAAFLELTFAGGSTNTDFGFGASETYRLIVNTTGTCGNRTLANWR